MAGRQLQPGDEACQRTRHQRRAQPGLLRQGHPAPSRPHPLLSGEGQGRAAHHCPQADTKMTLFV